MATSPRRPSALTARYTDARRVPVARARLILPALLLFASGAAALVYQVLWIKQLSLVVGVDVYAVTTGVSTFFAGRSGVPYSAGGPIALCGHSFSTRWWSSASPFSGSQRPSH